MTPKRDHLIRRRAEEILVWCESELAITDPWVAFDHDVDLSLRGAAFTAALEERSRQFRAFNARPDIRAIDEYRSWLSDLAAFCRFRRRHPIARFLKRSQHVGRREIEGREPEWMVRWYWVDRSDDLKTAPPRSIFGCGLPKLAAEGFAVVHLAYGRYPIRVDWSLGLAARMGPGFSIRWAGGDSDADISLGLNLPRLISLYVSFERVIPEGVGPGRWVAFSTPRRDGRTHYWQHDPRTIEAYVSGDHVRWQLWANDGAWTFGARKTAPWREGSFCIGDAVFGRSTHTVEQIGPPVQAVACFPEGQYTLVLQRERWTWKRPRWPWPLIFESVYIRLEKPPGFRGKGENSYDCGPDAIYGMGSKGHSYEDAVAAYVKAVLHERARYGHLAPEHRTVLTEQAR